MPSQKIDYWTEQEIEICRKFYPDYHALQSRLPNRSRASISGQCRRLDLTNTRHVWTAEEIERLRQLYPNTSWQELLIEFPFATIRMLQSIANTRGIYRTIEQQSSR